jgi:hypothetical protein
VIPAFAASATITVFRLAPLCRVRSRLRRLVFAALPPRLAVDPSTPVRSTRSNPIHSPDRRRRCRSSRCAVIGGVPIALKIVLAIVVFAPLVIWMVILVRVAITDGREAQRRKNVTRG